jgi:hypothetical protein
MGARNKFAVLAGAAMVSSCLFATATPASAAGECGSGYTQVDSYAIGSAGTLELYYNSSSGKNCAIARDSSPGSGYKAVYIGLENKPWADVDDGTFTYYAGPVYVSARGQCIDVRGDIGNTVTVKESVHCG